MAPHCARKYSQPHSLAGKRVASAPGVSTRKHLPRRVLAAYRARFETTKDRADRYVAFFEQGLQLLNERSVLAFICANRFTKNGYGKSLRAHIDLHYHVRHYVNLEHTQPFVGDVSAYPANFTLDRAKGQPTKSATIDRLDIGVLERLRDELLDIDGKLKGRGRRRSSTS